MNDITALAQRMKAAASEITKDTWQLNADEEVVHIDSEGYENFIACTAITDLAQFISIASPANVLALVEALEKAQRKVADLISENAALKGSVEKATGCIDAAYFEGLADVLAESSDERLVDLVKRRLLHAYLPVETPATDDALVAMGDAVLLEQLEDSRKAIVSQSNIIGLKEKHIAELESRTVTVKLPAACADDEYFNDGVFQPMRYERDVERALRAAGIQVIEGEGQ